MDTTLKYVPIFRVRQQEVIVLKSFDFHDRIYPCLEIIKEIDRLPAKPRNGSKTVPKPQKKFEEVYLPLIASIKAKKVFIDLPVHLKSVRGMKTETATFLRSVVIKRQQRTDYIKKFGPVASKVIPVISTYFNIDNERGSISLQEADLRPIFNVLAFRTFRNSFNNDIAQVTLIARACDYVIMDWEDSLLDNEDEELQEITEKLKTLKCTVIIHRNPIPKNITNVGLVHGAVIESINNNLVDKYAEFSGSCFSDYSGIKKDNIESGGGISPGFIYYDATKNIFYGYKGQVKNLKEFERTIVPAVIQSDASRRMKRHIVDFLGDENVGWKILIDISQGDEPGRSAAKFKRIGMEHYLHCLKSRIGNGDFE